MVRETWLQSHVTSYQILWKWYLIQPWLTLSIIRYVSRLKWSNPVEGVAPAHTPRCSSYWKVAFWSPSIPVANIHLTECKQKKCVFMLNWIVWNRTVLTFNYCKQKCIYTKLNCNFFLSKWLNSALNEPKRVKCHKTKPLRYIDLN